MKRKHKFLFAVITAILVTCTLFTSTIWASVSEPVKPESAVALWNSSTPAAETSGIIALDAGEILESDYFGAKFIPGITTVEPFGPWDDQDIAKTSYRSETLTSARIPAGDTSYQNNIGIWYRNVGNYKGRCVDLKATLENYDFYSNDGVTSHMIFWGRKNEIAFCVAGESWIDIRYEFFDAQSQEPLSLKAYMTFDDIDWGQAIEILDHPGQLYTPAVSNLRCMTTVNGSTVFLSDSAWYDDPSTAAHSSSIEDSFMTMFEGTRQLQRFYCSYYFREGYQSTKNFLSSYDDEAAMKIFCDALDYFGYSGEPLAATEPSTPVKQVTDSDESGEENTLSGISETFSYSIYHNVPNENPENYYQTYTLTDTMPDCLELISAAVYDESKTDVTEEFTVDFEEQTVTFSAVNPARADFYYDTYQFVMNVKIREDADLSEYLVQNSDGTYLYAFNNHGTVTVERDKVIQKDTNETTTRLEHLFDGGMLTVHKVDAVSHLPLPTAVFTLYEWNQFDEEYYEKETLIYDPKTTNFLSQKLENNAINQGKFKVVETRLPQKYDGAWEQEFELTEDEQLFEFEVTNMPYAGHTITKTAAIVKNDGLLLWDPGTQAEPVKVRQGDTIEYQITVIRDCAPGYRSGTFTVTDQIPGDCIWDKDTLKLAGQIINPLEDSAASIDSMTEEDGTITWMLTDLDDGEGATLSFQVQAPSEETLIENTAYLHLPDNPKLPSNTTFHQTPQTSEPSVTGTPTVSTGKNSGNTSPAISRKGSTSGGKAAASPVQTDDLTPVYSVITILILSGIGMIVMLIRKHFHR